MRVQFSPPRAIAAVKSSGYIEMRRLSSWARGALACLLPPAALAQLVSPLENENIRVWIGFNPSNSISSIQSISFLDTVDVHYNLMDQNLLVATVSRDFVSQLQNDPGVSFVEVLTHTMPVSIFFVFLRQKFIYLLFILFSIVLQEDVIRFAFSESVPYGITMVQAGPSMHEHDISPTSPKICIVDSGLDSNHEDLIGNLHINGSSLVSGLAWDYDQLGHGTHVAGTIAAIGDNNVGVRGVVANGVLPLHIVKIFGASGSTFSSIVYSAVQECLAVGARIINMSLGGPISSIAEQALYEKIADAGVLVFAASGNSGTTSYNFPASYPTVVSVGAVDADRNIAYFSQQNDQVAPLSAGFLLFEQILSKDVEIT